MKAEIGYKDKDTLIIDWGKEGTGFGQLTFKHKDGCKIEVDAECMDINHIIETILALKEDETYLKWESLGFLSDSTPFLGRLETAQSMEQMAQYMLSLETETMASPIETIIFPVIHGIIKGGGSVETIDLYDKLTEYINENWHQMDDHNHKTDLDMEAVLVSTFIKNYLNNE